MVLLERRLKITTTVNPTIKHLNQKNAYLGTVRNVICSIPSRNKNFWFFYYYFLILNDFGGTKKWKHWGG